MPHKQPPEPWRSFLRDIDKKLVQPVELRCIGGFAIAMLYGLPRPTVDVDYLSVVPLDETANLESVRPERVRRFTPSTACTFSTWASSPCPIAMRTGWPNIPVHVPNPAALGLDAYDLALSKLERNSARDREDVKFLARAVPLDTTVLEDRYRSELRPYLAAVERYDLTIRLWIEMIGS